MVNIKSNSPKRSYRSKTRSAQASQTKQRVLVAATELFQRHGFEKATIEMIAKSAKVSAPTLYAVFQSKRGILRALIDNALPIDQFQSLVDSAYQEKSSTARLKITTKIARQMYDAEQSQMDLLRGAAILTTELKKLEQEREKRRHQRLEKTIQMMSKENSLKQGITAKKAQDILWALTGRDLYRMFVLEQNWTSVQYEKWLAQLLINTLVDPEKEKNH